MSSQRFVGKVAPKLALKVLLVVTALLLPALPSGIAQAGAPPQPQLTVMTRNLYLGADLGPAVTATSPLAFVGAVATIYGTMLYTDFPTRAGALADEIKAAHPDLVGLQEVSRWTTVGPVGVPDLDYLQILLAKLSARGLNYVAVATSNNANLGPIPLFAPCATSFPSCSVTFQDRDVILMNADRAGLSVSGARHGRYVHQQVLQSPVGPLSFDRGWATVEVTLQGRSFRFADTHLETEDAPAVQQAQGQEFLAAVRTTKGVLAVGDFNSAADGSTTTTYASLTSDYFRDAARGVGNTCCENGTLTNPTPSLTSRIDLVLTHGPFPSLSAQRVGAVPFEAHPPFWASDHAGVVATVKLP